MSDRFTQDSLRALLGDRPFRFFAQVTSTQDLAREWARERMLPRERALARSNGDDLTGKRVAVVIAEEQTAGRGRQGRGWHSPPESAIMFSAIIEPDLPPDKLPRITMAGAVAVAEAMFPRLQHNVTLKWPNDVLIRGKKVGGVLSEAVWDGDTLHAVLLGVGVNVRVDFAGQEFAAHATNFETEVGRAHNRHDLLGLILARLDYWIARLDTDDLIAAWEKRLSTLGQPVTVSPRADMPDEARFSGTAEGVDEFGALMVRLADGELRRVLAGDVTLRSAAAAE